MATLATATPSGGRVLAVTSAGVIAALACRVMNLPDREIATLMGVTENASLTSILFSGKRLSLQSFNSSGHLSVDNLSEI